MTPPHGRRARVAFGLVLIALGIAVGVLAYLVGRAGGESAASPSAEPKGKLLIHATRAWIRPTSPRSPRTATAGRGAGSTGSFGATTSP